MAKAGARIRASTSLPVAFQLNFLEAEYVVMNALMSAGRWADFRLSGQPWLSRFLTLTLQLLLCWQRSLHGFRSVWLPRVEGNWKTNPRGCCTLSFMCHWQGQDIRSRCRTWCSCARSGLSSSLLRVTLGCDSYFGGFFCRAWKRQMLHRKGWWWLLSFPPPFCFSIYVFPWLCPGKKFPNYGAKGERIYVGFCRGRFLQAAPAARRAKPRWLPKRCRGVRMARGESAGARLAAAHQPASPGAEAVIANPRAPSSWLGGGRRGPALHSHQNVLAHVWEED